MALESRHQAFWQSYYDSGALPWDIQGPSPHFVAAFESADILFTFPKSPARLFVPGAGRGHDAVFFSRRGYQVTCLDLAPSAPSRAAEAYPEDIPAQLDYQSGDLFAADTLNQWAGSFDGVIEHTCFCAIPPSLRERYVDVAYLLLKPGGVLLGVFWEHSMPDGPPFSVTHSELMTYFSGQFDLLVQDVRPQNAAGRSGQESLYLWRKKSSA